MPPDSSTGKPLDYAERWLIDSLRVLRPSVVSYQLGVDMTAAMAQLDALRKEGVTATTTHQLVRAAARALAANPALHQLIAGTRRLRPARVDIGLSITGETFIAPVLVLEGADQKTLAELAGETARRVPEVRKADTEKLAGLRKWGWLVPFSAVRRAVMRRMFNTAAFQRQAAGTFQVSTVTVDSAATSVFVASGVLVGGRVWPRVVAIDGQPAVRQTMMLTLSGDHGVWDGRAAGRFLSAVKEELERAELP
jgi:pyruvate/2-oxoglutarate dehydrogenase complex dihydrolipoamide acyltransferase (E2) component